MIEPHCLTGDEGRVPLFQGGFAGHGKWFRGSWVHPGGEVARESLVLSKMVSATRSKPGRLPGETRMRARGRFRKATLPRRIAIAAQILTRDRALLVGICLDQARIDLHCFNSI
jgi:hypothetical protein